MQRARFNRLVLRALRDLPAPFRERLSNVDVVVKRRPGIRERRLGGSRAAGSFYGLYEGTPLIERDASFGLVLPDKITIFQEPLERDFPDEAELMEEIRKTVLHEVAHFFGVPDERMDGLGLA